MNLDTDVRSSRLPGGDLIGAVLGRQLMMYADRGGSSGLVGQRWADHCDLVVQGWAGGWSDVPGKPGEPILIERVARLDSVPNIARVASRRGLQNPDFIIIGDQHGHPAIQAADAKFSVETARARQVSVEVLESLLSLRSVLEPATGSIPIDARIEPGFFLSPDYSLTHFMMRKRNGVSRASVRDDEVELLPIDPTIFFASLEGASLIPVLAEIDALPIAPESSLLASLYYFRVARSVIGFWTDSVKPLLLMGDRIQIEEADVRAEAERRASAAGSAFELLLDWDRDVERVREQRTAVDQVSSLPVISKDLREQIAKIADALEIEAPSMNKVRKRLGAWFRGEIRARVGPLEPPVDDLPGVLRQLANIGAELVPRIPGETERIVLELAAEIPEEDEAVTAIA